MWFWSSVGARQYTAVCVHFKHIHWLTGSNFESWSHIIINLLNWNMLPLTIKVDKKCIFKTFEAFDLITKIRMITSQDKLSHKKIFNLLHLAVCHAKRKCLCDSNGCWLFFNWPNVCFWFQYIMMNYVSNRPHFTGFLPQDFKKRMFEEQEKSM